MVKSDEEIERERAELESLIGPTRAGWYAEACKVEYDAHPGEALWACRYREVAMEAGWLETALRQADAAAFARGVGEEREACCKAVCPDCACGAEVYLHQTDLYSVWRHLPDKSPCRADAIRRRAAKEEKT